MGDIQLTAILAAIAGMAVCAALILLLRNRKVEHMLSGLEHEVLMQNELLAELRLKEQERASEQAIGLVRLEETKDTLETQAANLSEKERLIDRLRADYHESEKRAEAASVKWDEALKREEKIKVDLYDQGSELESLRSTYEGLLSDHSALKASMEERELAMKQQLESFEGQKKQLTESFENLASRIFEEKGKTFTNTSRDAMEQMLKPFREQITEFRKRVDNIHQENNVATGSLRKELEQLRELNRHMTEDAKNLTDALKGDKKKVGSWGEIQLEKTLQQAGLVKGDHYQPQALFKDESGKNNYPDFVVKLPDGKHIVLDSKVSLVDYDAAIAAENEIELANALDRHVQAVKNHIDSLATKDYSNLIGMKSPGFVLMFMPIEPAYIEAMKHSQDLFNYGYHKNVIMVSHTTLMPILRTVANLWMIERSNAEAREISNKAGDVYNQVCMVAERLQKLGATLQTASKHYNSTVVALAGQQGLHGKVERFNRLSSKVTKSMPEIEPIHLDIEADRLEVIQMQEPELAGEPEALVAEAKVRVESLENENEK